MGAATAVKDQILDALKGTALGEKLADAAKAVEEWRKARIAARAKLDEAAKARKALPKKADAVEKAEAEYKAEMHRVSAQLAEARREYRSAVHAGDRLYARAEGHLRRTASPLVHDNGPVFHAIQTAIEHLREHSFLVGEEDRVRRTAKLTPLSDAREDTEAIDNAKAWVHDHDQAAEYIDAFAFAQAELRDLQLEVDAEPAAVREVLEGLPGECFCGRFKFKIEAALDRAVQPQEIK